MHFRGESASQQAGLTMVFSEKEMISGSLIKRARRFLSCFLRQRKVFKARELLFTISKGSPCSGKTFTSFILSVTELS